MDPFIEVRPDGTALVTDSRPRVVLRFLKTMNIDGSVINRGESCAVLESSAPWLVDNRCGVPADLKDEARFPVPEPLANLDALETVRFLRAAPITHGNV